MSSGKIGEADVLLAVRGAHEERLAQEFSSPRGNVRIARRCADMAELIAVATAGIGSAALICEEQQDFDREVVAELHAHRITIVALVEDDAGWRADRMRSLGVDAVCRLDEAADRLGEILVLPPAAPAPDPGAADLSDGMAAQVSAGDGTEPSTLPLPGPHTRRGQIIAVWGPGGAPGRTSLAINLATELAARPPGGARGRHRPEILLVDGDTYNPSLAQHLGLLDESAGLALAARAASQGRLDLVRLAELTPRLDQHLRVLSGIGRPGRWPEVPASSLGAVWEQARALADFTIIDCAAPIENDEALSYDTRAPQRNGATISALEAADIVMIVAGADPIGIQRLVRALGDLDDTGLVLRARRVVVVNRLRASVVGSQPTSALQDAIAHHARVNVDAFVPDDPAGFDSALLAGRTLAEVEPHSPARRAIAEIGEQVRQIGAMAPIGG